MLQFVRSSLFIATKDIVRILQRGCSKAATETVTSSTAEQFEKVYEVSPRCTVNGFVSYNTVLIPHDITNTTERDKVILRCAKPISVNQIGTALNLTTAREPMDPDTVCELHVPIKANINLTSLGYMTVGDLHGDGVRVFSEFGEVVLGNLRCEEIQAGTNDKDIITTGCLEATKIELLCRKKGAIRAQKIKTLGLKMDTNEGDITMEACYSKHGFLVTKTGNINVKNVHNRCRIETLKKGNVKMVGFEGALELAMQNGTIDVQIQKLFDNSDILIREEGQVTLSITDELLEYAEIVVWSKGCFVDDGLPYVEDHMRDETTIRKKGAKTTLALRVRCNKAGCTVRKASWVDMIVDKDFIERKQKQLLQAEQKEEELDKEETN